MKIKNIGKCSICRKEVTNKDGFVSFYKTQKHYIHYGECNKNYTLSIFEDHLTREISK